MYLRHSARHDRRGKGPLMRLPVLHALAVTMMCGLMGLAAPVRAAHSAVPEPNSYRMSDYRTPTPTTLDGKPALTTAEAHDLWLKRAAAFVDVHPQPPKPANLAPGTLWRDAPRFDIPGSIWLPDTGYGALAPVMEDYFRRGLKQATGGDMTKPLVVYCRPQCWMSWNAAKRAKSLGYAHVFWYSQGTEGWTAAGYALKEQPAFPRP
jgi:PQQ-dependent catabolism-associated CXXCW motif protein